MLSCAVFCFYINCVTLSLKVSLFLVRGRVWCFFSWISVRNPLKEEEEEIYVVLVLFGSSDWSSVAARVWLCLCMLHATLASSVQYCCFDEFEAKTDISWSCSLLWRLSDKKVL